MTEQEKREDEKREIAIVEIQNILFHKCVILKDSNLVCPRSTCRECTAMRIYDYYVLPKEEEVRKEMARKLLKGVEGRYPNRKHSPFYKYVKEAIKEFLGVEVEE